MSDELKVYLDHHILRENLRYRRAEEAFKEQPLSLHPTIRLSDLLRDDEHAQTLRKPDFQRSTWAWTPEDCVSLLDSLINGQVIPSIIMWRSPENGLRYILDGGHRISVVIAWLRDDWGYEQAEKLDNPQQVSSVKKAARDVRELVYREIGSIKDFEAAGFEIERLVRLGLSPKSEMKDTQNGKAFERGMFYNQLRTGDVYFNVLWVRGDYKTAEQSFLKINKSGRQLTEWETKLIENRDSSFARIVMSLSSIDNATHYWPVETNELNDLDSRNSVEEILSGASYLNSILFSPTYRRPVNTLEVPLLHATIDKKPYYLAELLTVIKGFRGQEAETEQLLRADRSEDPRIIVQNGLRLIEEAKYTFSHIIGNPDSRQDANQSLELIPLLYFYKSDGQYIRSLLYGFIYWLIQGTEKDLMLKKEIFSVYRGQFEKIFLTDKDELVHNIGRNVGSGSEVTIRTAKYFHSLLDLIMKHRGDIETDEFFGDYGVLSGEFFKSGKSSNTVLAVKGRLFTTKQKSTSLIDTLLNVSPVCEVCGGKLNASRRVQHDHVKRVRDGGITEASNQRILHPFCNQRRDRIEELRESQNAKLPTFIIPGNPEGPFQLKLFKDDAFDSW